MLDTGNRDNIRQGVLEELAGLLEDRGRSMTVREDMTLNGEVGLSSLELAELVSLLEQRFGLDPFRRSVAITSIRTVGDLCRAYETSESEPEQDPQLLEAVRRAEARRRRG
jgi:acyl carrier protein